jgi:hypothetical protein
MPLWTRRCALGLVLTMMAATIYADAGGPSESQGEPKQEPRNLTGTWVMLLAGHQLGLEVEDKSGTLEGTVYIMGQRVPVDGSITDGAFILTSDTQVGDTQSHGATVKMKITGQHKPDDTLEGEIELPRGPMKWTAERLKKP